MGRQSSLLEGLIQCNNISFIHSKLFGAGSCSVAGMEIQKYFHLVSALTSSVLDVETKWNLNGLPSWWVLSNDPKHLWKEPRGSSSISHHTGKIYQAAAF